MSLNSLRIHMLETFVGALTGNSGALSLSVKLTWSVFICQRCLVTPGKVVPPPLQHHPPSHFPIALTFWIPVAAAAAAAVELDPARLTPKLGCGSHLHV